jgi:hypothetical protein
MPTQIIDDFGIWDDLGTVVPQHEEWQLFPDFTESDSEIIRLQYGGDIDNCRSYGFIRAIYSRSNQELYGKWLRFYPKYPEETLVYYFPLDFNRTQPAPARRFQVQKRSYYRRYIGSFPDSIWTVRLLVRSQQATLTEVSSEQGQAFMVGLV